MDCVVLLSRPFRAWVVLLAKTQADGLVITHIFLNLNELSFYRLH